ncbi:MAG: PH domain-containing protein [Thermoplasmatales archaeon]|nr:PH domain-containing protein [Thermoplasmatales archaeon]
MYIYNAIAFAVLFAIFFAVWKYLPEAGLARNIENYVRWTTYAILAIVAAYLVLGPVIYYRRYRYIIDGDKVDVRKGIIFIRRSLTPIERIHQVDVSRGPILSMLGLANVTITTAGGVASLSYLEIPEAERVAEELNALVMKILKEGE